MSSSKSAELPEPRKRNGRLVLFALAMALVILAIIGFTGLLIFNSLKLAQHDAKPVAAKVTVTTFLSFPDDNIFPVGLARAANGTFYLTQFGTGAVYKSDLQGKLTPVVAAHAGISAGGAIAVGPDGNLYIIDYANQNLGTLKRIAPDGTIKAFGKPPANKLIGLFAQMAFDDLGNLYVTNPSYSEVWRYDSAGNSRVWWTLPAVSNVAALPTAIVFDATKHGFLIGDAGTGSIYRVALGDDGTAGDSLVVYRGLDLDVRAMALDDKDRILYAAWNHGQDELDRLEADGTVTLLANNFRAPTALVYNDNKAYVVNSDITGLAKILGGSVPSPFQARPPFTVDVVSIGS